MIVKDQETKDPENKDIEEDSVTTTGCNSYQAETTHSEFSPSEASSNTMSARSLARTPRTRATSELATPAETTEEDNETTITKYESTTPGSIKVKTVVPTAIIQSPHQDQGLLLGSPQNAQSIQDNNQTIQEKLPTFDS